MFHYVVVTGVSQWTIRNEREREREREREKGRERERERDGNLDKSETINKIHVFIFFSNKGQYGIMAYQWKINENWSETVCLRKENITGGILHVLWKYETTSYIWIITNL